MKPLVNTHPSPIKNAEIRENEIKVEILQRQLQAKEETTFELRHKLTDL